MPKKQKILIVDDLQQNLVALRQILSVLDVEIIEAVNGNDALAASLKHRFALAILDVMMPQMDGYELAELLRGDTKTRRLPIIFITAIYSEEERIFKGYEVGAVDYIVKPYNPEVLLSKVNVFLELDRARAELAEKVEALSASEERYRSLVATIPDIVYRIDSEGCFTYLNDAIQELGYTPEELLGSHFSSILVSAEVKNVSRKWVLPAYQGKSTGPEGAPKLFDERRTGNRISGGFEVHLLPRKGHQTMTGELHDGGPKVAVMEINSSGIYAGDPDGKKRILLGTVGVIRDITERKRNEKELAQYRQKLEELVHQRVKEQACLYAISEVVSQPLESVQTVLDQVIGHITSGWQYPEIASARLVLDQTTLTTKNFHESNWGLSAAIEIGGCQRGSVAVFYRQEKPAADEGPFLKEERQLIISIARLLAQTIERLEATAHEQHTNRVLRGIRNVNQLIVREKNRDRIIQEACKGLVRDRGFKGTWIVLTDRLPGQVAAAHCGFNDKSFSRLVRIFEKGQLPACCRRCQEDAGKTIFFSSPDECKRCPQSGTYEQAALLIAKLAYKETIFGYMGISVPAQFAADEEEHSLLEEIAGDIAFALHAIEVETAREIQARELALRNSIANVFLTVTDDQMYAEVSRIIVNETGSQYGIFAYLDEAGAAVVPSMSAEVMAGCHNPAKDNKFPHRTSGDSIWGQAIGQKQSLYANQPGKIPKDHLAVENALVVPILFQQEVIGYFLVSNKTGGYGPKDQERVGAIADYIAPVLQARLQRDRHERKREQSQRALKASEQKYQELYDSAPDMLASVDAENAVILDCNQTVCEVLGYSREEIISRPVFNLYAPQSVEAAKANVFIRLKEDGFFKGEEYQLQRKDGSILDVSLNATPIRGENGKILFIRSSWRDISQKKRLEARLLQAQKLESIGTLAGGIAHDFNNILSAVLGFTELSLDGVEKDSHLYKNLKEVHQAGLRARDLVKQILAFARQSDEEQGPLQIDSIGKEVLKLIRSSIPTSIEIQQYIEKTSLILGNPTQIHQIFMNLCTNAAQAMESDGGVLKIEIKDVTLERSPKGPALDLKPGDYVEVNVSDTGVGIEPEAMSAIFEPYYTTKAPGEGTGLGLAMVHGIVTAYGGHIAVNSVKGKGTTFTILFPVTEDEEVIKPYEIQELPTGSENILFVDDEEPIVNMASQVLRPLGYQVTTQTSSRNALALFRNQPEAFDLVITDMTMPDLSGDVLAAEIMAVRPDIPVILCTGFSKKISDKTAKAMGIRALAYKPIGKTDLVKTVRRVLDDVRQPIEWDE